MGPTEEPAIGSHLVTSRRLYDRHGIYVGQGRVIHYAGLARGLRRGSVEDVSLENFAHGHTIRVRHDPRRFDRREVVERARSRLGEYRYRILTNNCEHFCAWALRDETRSGQVERLLSLPRTICGRIEQNRRVIASGFRLWWHRRRLARTAEQSTTIPLTTELSRLLSETPKRPPTHRWFAFEGITRTQPTLL